MQFDVELLLIFIILLLAFKIYRMDEQIFLLKDKRKIHLQYDQAFQIFYELMENMFEAGVLQPRTDYVGYRCELIVDQFFKIVPDAKGKIDINLSVIKESDVYYDGVTGPVKDDSKITH